MEDKIQKRIDYLCYELVYSRKNNHYFRQQLKLTIRKIIKHKLKVKALVIKSE